jgi:phospholipid/cholesterol/gamma-HCH transport system substrate-binding protein
MTLTRQLRRHAVPLAAIAAMIVAALVVGGYIVVHQRLRLPGSDYYAIRVEMPTAQAITPGQGQTVTVSGVTVGEVGDVQLRDGRALVRLDIRRSKLASVHADATVLTRPRTPLDVMTIELDPGSVRSPVLDSQDVLPLSRSTPNVNVEEILAGLDADTRPALVALLNGAGQGLRNGGAIDLRRTLQRVRPVLVDAATVTQALRQRRVALRRLVTSLAELTQRVAREPDQLRRLLVGGNQTLSAVAEEDRAVAAALTRLPGTLQEADSALAATRPVAGQLPATLAALTPATKQLPDALGDLRRLAHDAQPTVTELRGLSTDGQPLATGLAAATGSLAPALPDLTQTAAVLERIGNLLAYNPAGPQEGYLFWLAWFSHNLNSMLSTRDGNGSWWRGQVTVSCSNLNALSALTPILKPLASAGICPK